MTSTAKLEALLGQEVGVSDWLQIDPKRGALFEHAVGPQPGDSVSPLLLLSLVPHLQSSVVLPIDPPRATINYGLDHIESGVPVAFGERVRARTFLEGVEWIGDAIQIRRRAVVENENSQMALCVITITRMVY